MTKQVCRSKSSIILRRVLPIAAVLLVFALVFVAPAAAVGEVATVGDTKFASLQEAINAAADGSTVTLLADVKDTNQILITKSLTLDLGAYTITGNSNDAVLRIYSPVVDTVINVVITATTGGIINTGSGYAIEAGKDLKLEDGSDGENDAERTNLTINGGNYETQGTDCVRQILGTCTINGGSYKSSIGRTVLNGVRWYGSEFVINDGTFYGFNPACVSVWTGFEGNDYDNYYHHHDIIAEGKTANFEDGWYTVVDGTYTAKVSTKSLCYPSVGAAIHAVVDMNDVNNLGTITLLGDDELTADDAQLAIDKGFSFILDGNTLILPACYSLTGNGETKKITKSGDAEINEQMFNDLAAALNSLQTSESVTPVTINLASVTHTLPELPEGKSITFKGGKGAVIKISTAITATADSPITFEGVTVQFTSNGGTQRSTNVGSTNVIYKGCTLISDVPVTFSQCTFSSSENTEYSVQINEGTDVTFSSCTFTTNNGKAVLVQSENENLVSIKLESCRFTSIATSTDKAAVEVKQNANGNAKYTIVINNGEATGFAEHGIPKTSFVGNEDAIASTDLSSDTYLSAKVDDEEMNKAYTLTFNTNGGTDVDQFKNVYGAEVPVPANPTKAAYVFKGWNPTLPSTMPAGDMTFTAVWERGIIVEFDMYTVLDIADQIYTGAEIIPAVTVKKNDSPLTSGYTVTYSDNIGVGPAKATVTLEGIADCIEIPFTILKDENPTVSMADVSVTHGHDYDMTPEAETIAGTPIADAEFTIRYYTDEACTEGETTEKPTTLGTYYANATLIGTDNYTEAYDHAKITITKADFADLVGITVTGIGLQQGYMGVDFIFDIAAENLLKAKAAEFIGYSFIYADISLIKDDGSKDSDTQATFLISYPTAWGINANNYQNYNFVVLHLKGGVVEVVPATASGEGLTVTTTLSPFAIGYSAKQTGGSSTPQGSNVWLTETPTPTETPTDVAPTDLPTTKPTPTETQSPGFGVLAVVAGLGAVAALRRK